MKLKKMIALGCVCAVAVANLMGCASTSAGDGGTGTPVEDKKPETPASKVRTDIVIGTSADVVTLDPHQSVDTSSARVINLVYDTLLDSTPEGEVVPGLATSYEQVDDTHYIFHLAENVKFHNGDPLTAATVKYSLERQMNSPQTKTYTEGISAVNVVDDLTVEVVLSQPHIPFLMNMTATQSSIVCQSVMENVDTNKADYKVAIGTGAMKFDVWNINDNVMLKRNEEYFRGPVATTSINFRAIPESGSRTIALETGEIDFLGDVAAVDIARMKENTDINTVEVPAAGIPFLAYNNRKAPFDNPKVRQALGMLIDRDAIVAAVYEGNGEAAKSFLANFSPVYNEDMNILKYDVEAAKALLAEAGHADGFKMTIAVSGDDRNKMAQLMQSDFAKANVIVDVSMLEWGAFLDHTVSPECDAFIVGFTTSMNPDAIFSPLFLSSNHGVGGNRYFYTNTEVDDCIIKARGENDLEARKALYRRAEEIILTEAPMTPLVQTYGIIAMNKGMEGVVVFPSSSHDYSNAVINE